MVGGERTASASRSAATGEGALWSLGVGRLDGRPALRSAATGEGARNAVGRVLRRGVSVRPAALRAAGRLLSFRAGMARLGLVFRLEVVFRLEDRFGEVARRARALLDPKVGRVRVRLRFEEVGEGRRKRLMGKTTPRGARGVSTVPAASRYSAKALEL